jgi:hypothetical protein
MTGRVKPKYGRTAGTFVQRKYYVAGLAVDLSREKTMSNAFFIHRPFKDDLQTSEVIQS